MDVANSLEALLEALFPRILLDLRSRRAIIDFFYCVCVCVCVCECAVTLSLNESLSAPY